ncbi:polysaccharide deacetylase family protein [Kitasatospora purpeofusca]|uniref:polysaccharide deacetylase family protein n=1 Tax=Kitasatospora purpeofusca TaxID=67352 RepID=UPI00224F3D2F|nr:polysaccharide deacetylase family protein [Kitasatospora purpeofusca]MCX4755530.1 polysaccharide deacetylase family protein [Kitasatospora purpeofusca]WSR36601.1 polysaccharide deacetylase family protein [Kitasatospora purpeofusca]
MAPAPTESPTPAPAPNSAALATPAPATPSPATGTPAPATATPAPSSPPASAAEPLPRVVTAAESRPVYELDAGRKVVAITVDDGPDPRYTPAVLALLDQYGIRASFFLIGENANAHPDLVREVAARGHHIANHSWSHPDLSGLSAAKVRDELGRTSELLGRLTGRAPTWFRAPGGGWSPTVLKVGAELGMRPMAWSVDPQDWATPGTDVITKRLEKELRPGAIVLTHDGGGDRSQTVAALKTFLPLLIDSGYRFTAPPG